MKNISDLSVGIILCTFNGEKFLEEQLKSIENQSFSNWKIYISDDGSIDQTVDILLKFQKRIRSNRVKIFQGEIKGFALNFLFTATKADKNHDFYSFCDQDDIWFKDKLMNSILRLQHTTDSLSPSLYCSVTTLVNSEGIFIRESLKRRPPCFRHSLVENIAGGNTMLFNNVAMRMFTSIPLDLKFPSHDWLLYQMVCGKGGVVFYDFQPSILYRQHSKNLVSTKFSLLGKLARLKSFFDGSYGVAIRQNVAIMSQDKSILTNQNKEILDKFVSLTSKNFFKKINFLFDGRFQRTSFVENIIFKVGNFFNLI